MGLPAVPQSHECGSTFCSGNQVRLGMCIPLPWHTPNAEAGLLCRSCCIITQQLYHGRYQSLQRLQPTVRGTRDRSLYNIPQSMFRTGGFQTHATTTVSRYTGSAQQDSQPIERVESLADRRQTREQWRGGPRNEGILLGLREELQIL